MRTWLVTINTRKQAGKLDKYRITREIDVGYDLQGSIVFSDQTEQSIAPVELFSD